MKSKEYTYTYTRRKVICKGKLDGRGWRWKFWPFQKEVHPVHPILNQKNPAVYENQLLQTGQDLLTDIATDWKNFDFKAKPAYCQAVKELEQAEKELDKENKELEYEKEEYKKAAEEFEAHHVPILSKTFEWVLLLFFMIGEYFLNYQIFTMLGLSKNETMIIAATMCVAIPMSGFFFGHLTRIENKTVTQRIWLIMISLFVLGVLIGITLLRAELFMDVSTKLRLNLSPFQMSLVFITINLLLFGISSLVSYLAAHRHPAEWRKAKLKLNDAKKRLSLESKENQQAIDRFEKAEIDVVKKKMERKKMHELLHEKAKDVIQNVKWYVMVYRTANQEVRKDGGTPDCFKQPPNHLHMPTQLLPQSLNWDCSDSNIQNNSQKPE